MTLKPMTDQALIARLQKFPDFAGIPDEAAAELLERTRVIHVTSEEVLATQGSPCKFFPVVLSGRARIYMMDEEGRETTLYRVGPGDGCVLAAACCVSDTPLPGFVIVEETGEALFIPSEALQAWVDRYRFWRDYVFTLVARQLEQVVAVANDLAFRRVDARVANFLLHSAGDSGGVVRATHHAVAMEVGSRREVVSRVLKTFEQDRIVALDRGAIRVRDRRGLAERAGPAIATTAFSSLLGGLR